MSTRKKDLAPRQVGVKTLPPDDLHPNPHNPRALFDREPLAILQASIRKVGILVPLTVYFDTKRNRYVILDGQRRWMCAQALKLESVPVNQVEEPTLVQNIVTMFQIHKLRADWELMPTALKLELLMEELQERRDKSIAALTGLDQAVVQRCKKLLVYPRKYQNMMLDGDPSKRVKADFFIELYAVRNDRLVNSFEWYSKDRFTTAMLARYQSGGLKSVTDFRLIKQHINNARDADKQQQISRRLERFTGDPAIPISYLEVGNVAAVAEAKKMRKQIEKLRSQIEVLDVDACIGEEEFWEALEALLTLASEKLHEAGRREAR